MNEAAVSLLERAVSEWDPAKDPDPDPGNSWPCALARLKHMTDPTSLDTLTGVALATGFSAAEAHGIMDGWDVECGERVFWADEADVDPSGYGAGFELGKRLARCRSSEDDFDERCVICQNEGAHDVSDRPHVMEGQE